MDVPTYPFVVWGMMLGVLYFYILIYYPYKNRYLTRSPFWNSISGSMVLFLQTNQIRKMIEDHEEGSAISWSEYFGTFLAFSVVIMYFALFWMEWKREETFRVILAQLMERFPEESQMRLEEMVEVAMRRNPNVGVNDGIGAPTAG